jgi:hypothetical protein
LKYPEGIEGQARVNPMSPPKLSSYSGGGCVSVCID